MNNTLVEKRGRNATSYGRPSTQRCKIYTKSNDKNSIPHHTATTPQQVDNHKTRKHSLTKSLVKQISSSCSKFQFSFLSFNSKPPSPPITPSHPDWHNGGPFFHSNDVQEILPRRFIPRTMPNRPNPVFLFTVNLVA